MLSCAIKTEVTGLLSVSSEQQLIFSFKNKEALQQLQQSVVLVTAVINVIIIYLLNILSDVEADLLYGGVDIDSVHSNVAPESRDLAV